MNDPPNLEGRIFIHWKETRQSDEKPVVYTKSNSTFRRLLHCIVNASGAVYKIHDGIIGKAVMAGIMIVITLLIVCLNDKKIIR